MEVKNIVWWKEAKLMIGVTLVVLSFIMGFYSKIYIIAKLSEPISLITGLSAYAISWLMLFFGAFLVGWETVKIVQRRIHHEVKKTVKTTYHYTKQIPIKSIEYTRKLRNRFKPKPKQKGITILK